MRNKILVVTDIFGCGQSIDDLKAHLASQGFTVVVLDPYNGDYQHFANEAQAYAGFVKQCGHDNYYQSACDIMTDFAPQFALGFSAGASVVWRLSANHYQHLTATLCFYPSQIRHHLEIDPKVTSQVIFPQSEPMFDVSQVAQRLSQTALVTSDIFTYSHGFMNSASPAYDIAGQKQGIALIKQFLTD